MKLYLKTPLFPLTRINQKFHKNFQIKMECYQPSGSFKIRGISYVCLDAKKKGISHLICASGGNAGYAVAYCARTLGMKCTIVIPKSASNYMAEVIRREGADVIVHGDIFDDANDFALQITREDKNAMFVHPFENPLLWEGHSTIVDELKEQTDKPDAIVLSVGGGGLLNGVIQGIDRNGWSDVPVIACEVEGAPKFNLSLKAGKPIYLDEIHTLANTLAGKTVSPESIAYAKNHNIISYLTGDANAAHAVFEFIDDFRVIVELACGASMSVAYDEPEIIRPYHHIVVIACGGSGVNLPLLLQYKQIFNL